MRHDSTGRRLLMRVLQEHTATAVAHVCRVSRPAVSQWALGVTTPRDRMRVVLMTRYKIPTGSWCEPPSAS